MTHPALNASLNAVAAVLLFAGYIAIRRGNRELHGKLMGSAFAVSKAFLASYLVYHATSEPTKYGREDWTRAVYFVILITHVILAAVNLPMVLRTIWLARKKDWERHRKWARWTFPIWLYVSVTGVAVYAVLYHFNPPAVS